ncbi:MAG: hypothetical protein MUF72_15725 [Elainella sp. Prado103]|jgi:hypothetical protein|nr:hypothetical protein [Elainella sp. Prado103]
MPQSMTKAVWAFWSKPFQTHRQSTWLSPKDHLLSWILSFERARRHYPETILITDDDGIRLLVDGLGLEFHHVSNELNVLRSQDPDWWVSGKLYAYRSQTQPFVHLDSDVFLWKALPEKMTTAPIFAQNPEYFTFGDPNSWYRPEICTARINANQGWLPEEWQFYVANRGERGISCGILGGNAVDFINYYADKAIQLIESPENQLALSFLDQRVDSVLVEQYFLSACIMYHQNKTDSPYHNIEIQYLFNSPQDAFSTAKATDAGYTHLIAGAKRNRDLMEKLERRVAMDYPDRYQQCLKYWSQIS